MIYLYVALGGAIGASLRYFITTESIKCLGPEFPYGTLLVNVIGSFAMGILYAVIQAQTEISEPVRVFIGVGLLGALTTFSTFSLDTYTLLQQGEAVKAIANVALNLCLCIASVWLALFLVKG